MLCLQPLPDAFWVLVLPLGVPQCPLCSQVGMLPSGVSLPFSV